MSRLALAFALFAPVTAAAQTTRDFTTSRQLHGESRLEARVAYEAGSLRIVPSAAGDLYRMHVTYDSDRFAPVSAFDAAAGVARLGLESVGTGFRVSSRRRVEQSGFLALSSRVALSLALELGAGDGDIELGGLQLTRLRLSTGASRTTVRFSRPNSSRCERADLSAGAADISLLALGNARCQLVRFDGGVGTTLLDLTGAWPADARLDVHLAIGALTLRIPRGLGVRLTVDRFLSSFSSGGWTRQGKVYLSPGYARASRHIDLALATAFGGVDVEWVN